MADRHISTVRAVSSLVLPVNSETVFFFINALHFDFFYNCIHYADNASARKLENEYLNGNLMNNKHLDLFRNCNLFRKKDKR